VLKGVLVRGTRRLRESTPWFSRATCGFSCPIEELPFESIYG
jgi:hypothetical protein